MNLQAEASFRYQNRFILLCSHAEKHIIFYLYTQTWQVVSSGFGVERERSQCFQQRQRSPITSLPFFFHLLRLLCRDGDAVACTVGTIEKQHTHTYTYHHHRNVSHFFRPNSNESKHIALHSAAQSIIRFASSAHSNGYKNQVSEHDYDTMTMY